MSGIILSGGETISSALARAKKGDTIVLEDKTYREKTEIDVPDVTIVGGGANCRIVYGDYAKKTHADGMEYNTFRTHTVIVTAKNVTIKDLKIENDAGAPAEKGQQIALSVYADGFRAENVTLVSTQDTLFCGPLPDDLITRYDGFLPDKHRYFEGQTEQLFFKCRIFGSVDYVFGCGSAYFVDCDFITVDDGRKEAFVAAPAHALKQKNGFTFINCRFTLGGDFAKTVYLSRPWRDYGKAVFINCATECICGEVFNKWNDTDRDKTARFGVYGVKLLPQVVKWLKVLTPKEVKKYLTKADRLIEKSVK